MPHLTFPYNVFPPKALEGFASKGEKLVLAFKKLSEEDYFSREPFYRDFLLLHFAAPNTRFPQTLAHAVVEADGEHSSLRSYLEYPFLAGKDPAEPLRVYLNLGREKTSLSGAQGVASIALDRIATEVGLKVHQPVLNRIFPTWKMTVERFSSDRRNDIFFAPPHFYDYVSFG